MPDLVGMWRTERESLKKKLDALDVLLKEYGGSVKKLVGAQRARKKMSAATKKKLSQLAKARWAKRKAKG